MLRNKEFLVGVVAAITVTLSASPASATTWVDAHCSGASSPNDGVGGSAMSSWTRANAQSYAYVGNKEGYQWGGGCNNDDDVDNSPGQRTEDTSTRGEGTDCSGLVYKSWALPHTNVDGYTSWARLNYEHGTPNSTAYKNGTWGSGTAAAYYKLSSKSRTSTAKMDAFAKNGHIGLLYTNDGTSSGLDYIMESYNEKDGTDLNVRNYRTNSDYSGVRRDQWQTDGYCHMCA